MLVVIVVVFILETGQRPSERLNIIIRGSRVLFV